MQLLEGEHVLWQGRPSWRSNLSHFIVWIPIALLPAIIAGTLTAKDHGTGLPYPTWIGITIILVILVVGIDAIRRYATYYWITTQRLVVRHGILTRREQTARFDRIQNVSITQSLMDRLLSVGAVSFDTAGTDERASDFTFRGISDPESVVRIVAENSLHPGAEPTLGL
jgi:uncharacterized membrane protein YdbT with pleckstrin-like domain